MLPESEKGFDVATQIPVALGRIFVVSLITAIFLRLANRLSIKAAVSYKTAYLASLATNLITFTLSLAAGALLGLFSLSASFATLPVMLIAVPINAVVYSQMIKRQDASELGYKSALLLSVTFLGITFGLALVLVGSLLAIGFLANK